MNSIQYTIRSVPPQIDKALRQQARSSGKSLNEVVVETLAKGSGLQPSARFDDLDWFIGSSTLDKRQWDEAMVWLDSAPKELD
jgi:hypothetical protein